jgi:hypothetical protein
MSLLWFQRNPLLTDWVAQREVVAAFDSLIGHRSSTRFNRWMRATI